MAKGDTKTNQYLDIAANGTRADLPADTCCETRSQTLIREVAERIMDVEDEIDEIKNNPDVVDIVPTYADLQAYDTQHLTDKDIIRVLQDETHDGESTYYRYNKQSDTWTYVGESKQYEDFVGTDGTAAGEAGLVPAPATTDAGKFLSASGLWEEVAGGGGITELTSADYNYPDDNPTGVALWRLDGGLYKTSGSVNCFISTSTTTNPSSGETILILKAPSSNPNYARTFIMLQNPNSSNLPGTFLVNNFGSDVLDGNKWATLSNIYADPSTRNNVQIGGSSPSALNTSVAIGAGAAAQGSRSVGIGPYANTGQSYSVALGASSSTSSGGEVSIGGANLGTHGYNNSSYRLLTNVYDPQNDHDAATKGYVDGLVGNVALALNAINNGGGN